MARMQWRKYTHAMPTLRARHEATTHTQCQWTADRQQYQTYILKREHAQSTLPMLLMHHRGRAGKLRRKEGLMHLMSKMLHLINGMRLH